MIRPFSSLFWTTGANIDREKHQWKKTDVRSLWFLEVTMVFRWFFALLTLISFPLTAHGQEEASIRSRLEALKIPFSEEAFLEEIREGNAETVSLFLEGGMGPNVLDSNGRSALVW